MTLIPSSIHDESTLALDRQGDRLQALPLAGLLVYLVDVAAEDVLTHLAWQFRIFHTVAWRNAGNIDARRGLIKSAWRRHRLKGTLAGFKMAAADAGCEVVHAVSPPAKIYPSPALTVAERNAFVARYPQLRIYRYRTAGIQTGIMPGDCLGLRFPVQSDAVLRINPRAVLVKGGVETELNVLERTVVSSTRVAESATVTEVVIPGAAGRLSFACAWPRFLTVTDAPRRFYRMTIGTAYREESATVRKIAVDPGLLPISIRPDTIAETGVAAGIFSSRFVCGQFRPSTARDRIYQRFYLFDPEIDVEQRKAISHLNAGRFGMPRHHAELALIVPGRVLPQAAGRFVRGFTVAMPKTRLADCLEAMRDMSRASDRISLSLSAKQPITSGAAIVSGDYLAGGWI